MVIQFGLVTANDEQLWRREQTLCAAYLGIKTGNYSPWFPLLCQQGLESSGATVGLIGPSLATQIQHKLVYVAVLVASGKVTCSIQSSCNIVFSCRPRLGLCVTNSFGRNFGAIGTRIPITVHGCNRVLVFPVRCQILIQIRRFGFAVDDCAVSGDLETSCARYFVPGEADTC